MPEIPAFNKALEHYTDAKEIQEALSALFENLLSKYGDTPETRLMIVHYTMGYMGASYGLHIKG